MCMAFVGLDKCKQQAEGGNVRSVVGLFWGGLCTDSGSVRSLSMRKEMEKKGVVLVPSCAIYQPSVFA